MKLFHQNTLDETQPVILEIVTPELGHFAIEGSYDDVEPSYNHILREQARIKPRRHAGKYALAGF